MKNKLNEHILDYMSKIRRENGLTVENFTEIKESEYALYLNHKRNDFLGKSYSHIMDLTDIMIEAEANLLLEQRDSGRIIKYFKNNNNGYCIPILGQKKDLENITNNSNKPACLEDNYLSCRYMKEDKDINDSIKASCNYSKYCYNKDIYNNKQLCNWKPED